MHCVCHFCRLLLAVALGLALPVFGQSRYLGAAINDPFTMSYERIEKPDVKGKPLLNTLLDSPEVYWANQVEQYEAAGLDFVAPWLKGRSPVQGKVGNTPERLAALVKAIEVRGLTGKLTILPYDDNPASWTAAWNFAEGRGYGYAKPFPVDNREFWAYVWDYNFKAFFDTVPEKHLCKIDGRPVIAIWSCSSTFLSGMSGHGSRLILYLKDQCRQRYGWTPHFRAPVEWIKADPTSAEPGIVDSTAAWFEPNPRKHPYSYSVQRHGNFVNAVLIPSFEVNGEFWDPDHGRTLEENLRITRMEQAANLTLVEGFDNYFEDCSLWRVRQLTAAGTPIPYEESGYDFPNQRINLLRKYSNHPFPETLRLEAEWCDDFGGFASVTNRYRNGSIAIHPSPDPSDPPHSYVVEANRPGAWLEWREVPLRGRLQLRFRYASVDKDGRLTVWIDGSRRHILQLSPTGGPDQYREVTTPLVDVPREGYHRVRLVVDAGKVNLNYWQVELRKPAR